MRPSSLEFTDRERQVAELMAKGFSMSAAARHLGLSRQRIRTLALAVRKREQEHPLYTGNEPQTFEQWLANQRMKAFDALVLRGGYWQITRKTGGHHQVVGFIKKWTSPKSKT